MPASLSAALPGLSLGELLAVQGFAPLANYRRPFRASCSILAVATLQRESADFTARASVILEKFMSDLPKPTPAQLARIARQHADSLRAAGVEWLPAASPSPVE